MPLSWMMLRKQGALTNVETWLLFDPPIKIPGYVPVHNRPNKPDYDVTFAPRVCAVDGCLRTNMWFLTILMTQVAQNSMLYASSSH